MSSYSPPIEDVAIFDTALFRAGDAFITQSQADKRYLRFPNAQGTENLQAINVNGLATFSGSADIVQQAGSQILQQPASTGYSTNGNALNETSIRTNFGQTNNPTLEITDITSNNSISIVTNALNNAFDPIVSAGDSVIASTSATSGAALTLTNTNSLNNNTNGLRLATNFIVLGYGGSVDTPSNRLGIDANGINVIGGLVTTQGTNLSVQSTNVAFTSTTPPTSAQTIPAANDSSTKIPTTAWVQSAISAGGGSTLLTSNNTWTGTQNWTNTNVGSLTSSATQPASSDSSTKIPTTAWVQSAISAAPSQFVPRFVNYTDIQTTSGSGYSSGPLITFGGTWGIDDIAYVRVTSQISYNNPGSGYLNTGNTSGLLYFRPYYMTAGWAPVSGSVVIYTQNTPAAQMGAAQKPAYYVPAFNVGTIGKFCLNGGTANSVRVSTLSPETTGGWELFVSLEYLGASTSAGTLTFSAGAGTNITNNILP